VLDEYFDIASENRLSGTIVTQPRIGSTLGEPWAGDSVDFRGTARVHFANDSSLRASDRDPCA